MQALLNYYGGGYMEIEFNNKKEFVGFLKRLTNKTLITRERLMEGVNVNTQICVETSYTFRNNNAGKPCVEINQVVIPA